MKHTLKTLLGGLLLSALPLCAEAPASLDKLYGVASQPAYIKHYEADKTGKVILNPYLQIASKDFPAILDVKMAPYNWVIDTEGRVAIAPEAAHPLGRTYEKGFFRPEDQSQRKPGTRENFGHVSELGGAPGRISGEILYDKASNTWTLNNKSGRYSKHNTDRTPEQLVNAAKLRPRDRGPGHGDVGKRRLPPRVLARADPGRAHEEPEARVRRREEEEPPARGGDGGRGARDPVREGVRSPQAGRDDGDEGRREARRQAGRRPEEEDEEAQSREQRRPVVNETRS